MNNKDRQKVGFEMRKEMRFLIIDLLIGISTRFVGVAKAVDPEEDNCPENGGEYMYYLDRTTPLWTSIYDVHQEENFFYWWTPNSNKIIKLAELK